MDTYEIVRINMPNGWNGKRTEEVLQTFTASDNLAAMNIFYEITEPLRSDKTYYFCQKIERVFIGPRQ